MENSYADALLKLANSRDSDLMKAIPVEKLNWTSIDESLAHTAMKISESSRWMKEIIVYLTDQVLPSDKQEVQKLYRRATKKNGPGTESLETGVLLANYEERFHNYAKKCDRCQKFATIPKAPGLEPYSNHQSLAFCQVGDRLHRSPSQLEGVGSSLRSVVVDYFTKWCEAEPLAKITEENTWKFV
ncbi:Ribonuclease H [Abeliophyllum distichum]|uniref:Ribonuclease H n=1 Tax=Abeliophyllum distichum TaxID=126358 RepID=A0ABD1V334_9LAMI